MARTMRALALTFAVVGVLFVAWPDGTLHRLDQVGNWFGGFAHAPKSPNGSRPRLPMVQRPKVNLWFGCGWKESGLTEKLH